MNPAPLLLVGLGLLAPDGRNSDQDLSECRSIARDAGDNHPSIPATMRACLLARGWVEIPLYRSQREQDARR